MKRQEIEAEELCDPPHGPFESDQAQCASGPGEQDQSQSDGDSDAIGCQIGPLGPLVVNDALADLDGGPQAQQQKGAGPQLPAARAQKQRWKRGDSKSQNVRNRMQAAALTGHMKPERLEGKQDEQQDPDRARPPKSDPL